MKLPSVLFGLVAASSLLEEIGVGKVFVINLEKRADRLKHVNTLLGELGIPFTRMAAIDSGQVIQKKSTEYQEDDIFDKEIAVTKRTFCEICSNLPRGRKAGEVGCWLSHLKIYLEISRAKDEHPTLILEDDVDLDTDVKQKLRETLNTLPDDWEMFFLGWGSHIKEFQPVGRNTARVHERIWGAHAYVVRNSAVARKLIRLSNTKYLQVADWLYIDSIKSGHLKAYLAYPEKLATQIDLKSDIREKINLSMSCPIKNSLYRHLAKDQ